MDSVTFKPNIKKKSKPSQKTKICPPGKVLNPKTNRCIKIKVVKVVKKVDKKICPPGKVLNPKTKRCNKIKIPKALKNIKYHSGKVKDVLENLVTINGHGSFSKQKIKVPEGFHILIPHRNGLDIDYTTPDADKNKLYEEYLYKNKYLNYRDGWKLYLPGDDINNLGIHIFHDGISCPSIKSQHRLQRDLIEKCESNHSYNHFCPLYCSKQKGNNYDYILYKGKRKLKLKACGNYRLKDLFQNLTKQLNKIPTEHRRNILPKKDDPIVLIPFTCNAKSSSSQLNSFDHNNRSKLNTIYQGLIKNR